MAEDWLAHTLLSLTGTSDARLAAARMADHALGTNDCPDSVFEIAARHNILPLIREVAHGPSGSVSPLNGSYVISLNSNDNEARRRFTLAHEIGHVLIAQASGRGIHETEDYRTERLLDEFASRVVCPDRVAEKWFKSVGEEISVRTLESATKYLAVSMMVLVKRLGQMRLLDHSERGLIIGAHARSRKAKSQPALRVHQAASPSWGFIPTNRRFSSIGLEGATEIFERVKKGRTATGILRGSARIMVKRIPSYRWLTLQTNLEQKIYRIRTTGEHFILVVFEWPRGEEEPLSSSIAP